MSNPTPAGRVLTDKQPSAVTIIEIDIEIAIFAIRFSPIFPA